MLELNTRYTIRIDNVPNSSLNTIVLKAEIAEYTIGKYPKRFKITLDEIKEYFLTYPISNGCASEIDWDSIDIPDATIVE